MPDWPAEYAALAAADRDGSLSAPELEDLAVAATLLGHDDEVVVLRERAMELYLAAGETHAAVLCAFWLGFHLQTTGASARAAGWVERLSVLAAESDDPWLRGMLDQPRAAGLMYSGDPTGALGLFERAARSARAEGSVDQYVLARLGQGRCLQMLSRDVEARTVLDEVMVYVTARRVQPQVVGLAYCSMIELCRAWYDVRRAQEWTEALTGWVAEQEGMLPYRGTCLVHRAELLQLHGAWAEAVAQADEACAQLRAASERAAGPAHYRIGELARLRGDLDAAERAFERAAAVGQEVQPGLARLRLAQGRPDAALAGLDRALAERRDVRAVPELLCARVEACLATGDLADGRATLDRLTPLVADGSPPFLRAMAAYAEGIVRCASGDWAGALPRLREAFSTWTDLDARYEAATAQLTLGRTCARLGDSDAAAMEEAAALSALEALGATVPEWLVDGPPATGAGDGVAPGGPASNDCPLSPRELEVLQILATGASNRAIAAQLVLSEKTVARHLSNIFAKLGVTSRSAATARAFEHHWA
ncbi:LuxR C-terminal-related transcriptional regulator [Monashia sp. NPDC004114]